MRDLDRAGRRAADRSRAMPDALEIGGAVTYTQALPHLDAHFPAFGALVRRIGSRQIRNLGTIAGNLATASPIGDTLPCLIALDATVTLRSRGGTRALPVEDFITGYRKTALRARRSDRRDPHSARCRAGQRFCRLQALEALRPGHLDRDRRVPPRRWTAARCASSAPPMAAWRRAPCARAASRRRARRPRLEPACAQPTSTRLLARDFTPMGDHRGGAALPAARGREPGAAASSSRRHRGRARPGWRRYERHRSAASAAASTPPCATTAPSAMSPAARSISTTCRTCRARSKPRWC